MDRPDHPIRREKVVRVDVEADARSCRQLKQLVRYFVGKADMTWEYRLDDQTDTIDVYMD